MSYQLFWLIPERVIYLRYAGIVDFESYKESIDQVYQWIESHPSLDTLYSIVDCYYLEKQEVTVAQLREMHRGRKRTKFMVVVKSQNAVMFSWIKVIMDTLRLFLGWDHMRVVNTPAESLEWLAEKDPTLKETLQGIRDIDAVLLQQPVN